MNDSVYFEGDPATDSARRHMERVLKGPERTARWPWVLAALGSGGVWLVWHWTSAATRDKAAAGHPTGARGDRTPSAGLDAK